MHELNITKKLLDVALAEAQLQPGERVQRLHIALDPNSGYAPESIRFYFEHIARNSAAADAELDFEWNESGQPIRLTQVDVTEGDVVLHQSTALQPTLAHWQLEFGDSTLRPELIDFINDLLLDLNLHGDLQILPDRTLLQIYGQFDELAHFCHHLRHDAPAASASDFDVIARM